MTKINQINGRINVFNSTTYFTIGEIVLFVEHTFLFHFDIVNNKILTTYFVPENTTAIVRDFMLYENYESSYHVIPTVFYYSNVFGTYYLPRELTTRITLGSEKFAYVKLKGKQQWYTQTMVVMPPEIDHNMLRKE